MQGDPRDIHVDGKTVHVVLACDWLINASRTLDIRPEQDA